MKIKGTFQDKLTGWDAAQKTAVSVRDGILEYLGAELGLEPADKVFRVYRSPATIANAAALMAGIPVTNDHVGVGTDVTNPRGAVVSSRMIDLIMPETDTRIGVINQVEIQPELIAQLDAGKRELSLGYHADLVPAQDGANFDLEQVEIFPHHLAIVQAGRCGSVCSFIDRQPTKDDSTMTKKPAAPALKLDKMFQDADGNPSLTEIVRIAQALPEALKMLPADKLMEVLPVLQEIVAAAGGTPAPEAAADEETPAEEPAPVADVAEEKEKPAMQDSKEFKDATAKLIARHVEVMDKARHFLPAEYAYTGKTSAQIMRDALAVEHGTQKFADSELDVAFKLLKKTASKYQNFGDGAAVGTKFAALSDKQI